MKTCMWVSFAVLAVLAAGCRRDPYMDSYLDTLNAEKRALEDQIYDLQFDYEQAVRELEQCRKQLGTTRPSPAGRDNRLSPPSVVVPDDQEPEVPGDIDLSPPTIDPGTPTDPEVADPAAGENIPVPNADDNASASDASDRVHAIVLNAAQTGGADFDGQPGDDGLRVTIEPRDADGRYVEHLGSVAVVLLDPAKTGSEAQVARWDFDREQTQLAMRRAARSKGIRLEMRWPEGQYPENADLRLFVRLTTADGRKLETDRQIVVSLPDQLSARWTPRRAGSSVSDDAVNLARQPRPLPEPARQSPPPRTPPPRPSWQPYR